MDAEVKQGVRRVTLSTNRQVGLAAEFARKLGVRPRSKLLEVLVRMPDGAYAVLLMRRPRDYATALAGTLAGRDTPDEFLARIRAEWPR